MSRTRKGKKAPGYDFWSKRCFGNRSLGYGPFAKKVTKRKERAMDRILERSAKLKGE